MKRPSVATIPIVLLLTVVAAGVLWWLGDLRPTTSALPTGATLTRTTGVAQVGGPFSLIDQNGMRRTDADFRGKFMLVFFGYTFCPDVCPTTLAAESEAFRILGTSAERIVPVFISVDPKRDTPDIMKAYLSAFGPQFVGLTGTDEEIAAAAGAYRVYYKSNAADGPDYTVDHSSVIYVMGPDGAFITNYGLDDGPDAIADDLRRRLSDAS